MAPSDRSWRPAIEHSHGPVRVYCGSQVAAAWAEEFVEVLMIEFKKLSGHALPSGVLVVIEPDHEPPWPVHRQLAASQRNVDPQFLFGGSIDDPLDIVGALSLSRHTIRELGISVDPRGLEWYCAVLTEAGVRSRCSELQSALRNELSHRADAPGALVMMGLAFCLIGEEQTEHTVMLCHLQRLAFVATTAIGALELTERERVPLRERVNNHFVTAIKEWRKQRPTVRD
jgi:hypothetical protein